MKKFVFILVIITFCSSITFAAKHNYLFVGIIADSSYQECKIRNKEDAKIVQLFTQLTLDTKKFTLNDFIAKIGENGYKIVHAWGEPFSSSFIIEKE